MEQEAPMDPFYVMDMGMLITLYQSWSYHLPTIKPFFPVRCNPDKTLLAVLANLGANFDCASGDEIAHVLNLGVSPDRILFSNPCKPESHIKRAASVGVKMLVYDSVEELEKIHRHQSNWSLLLHIDVSCSSPHQGSSQCGIRAKKRGALAAEVIPLLKHAQQLRLNVLGVSVEPESCGSQPVTNRAALETVHSSFQAFSQLGLPRPSVLNVGGGFVHGTSFTKEAATFGQALKSQFSNISNLVIIATPGRYLAETAMLLVVNVIGKRVRGEIREYWINDGVYGSMNSLIYHQRPIHVMPFACKSNRANPSCKGLSTFRSTVFGPTCDALDTVFTDRQLPELYVGDWLVLPDMGAYAQASASDFNGFYASSISTKYVFAKPSINKG